MDNLPLGAEYDTKAPYNQPLDKEVEVTVSITLSKTVKVLVDDYKHDEDGYDFSECDLKGAVENQIYLPYKASKELEKLLPDTSRHVKNIINGLSNWNVDEMECIIE